MRNLLAVTAIAALATAAPAQVARRTIGAATLENVPAIPPEVAAAVARYQQSRSASVADWAEDGSLLITTRFGTTAQLHRVAGPGMDRRQLTFAAEPIAGAQAIPGSDRILYGRDTGGDEWFQLYALTPDGRSVQLTETGTRNSGPVIARDGGRVFWSQSIKGSGDYNILAANPADPASRVVVLKGTGSIGPDDVSPDGRTLLISRTVSNREQKLFTMSSGGGTLTEIAVGSPALLQGARFARGGRSVLAISDRGSDVKRLVEIDVASGRMTPASTASKWNVEDFDPSDDGRILAYAMNEDGYSKVVVQDFVTRRARPQPTPPAGVVGNLRLSRDGKRLAIGLASATAPGDVWAWDVSEGKLERWTQSEIGAIDRATLPEPRLVRFDSFDKLSVPAFVYRPKNAAPGVRTPVLISIHGGPEAQARPGWLPTIASFVGTLGATVIVPNVRGSDGYGTRYLNMDNAEKREDSVRDIGALLAEAYRRDNRRAEYGDERTPAMKAVFARISPRANVAKITKPMLIEQGANDPRVPQAESEQMVVALRARGVPVSYLLFGDEGHGWRKKPNADLSLQVETVFLRQVLGAK